MYKLEVKLKQHTPLIHFQHNQDGATLRASEVKPKLDRFILTKLGEDNCEMVKKEYKKEYDDKLKDIQKKDSDVFDLSFYDTGCIYASKQDWLIKGKDGALDYKIGIQNHNRDSDIKLNVRNNKKNKPETSSFPMLLANMGGKDSKEELMNFSISKFVVINFVFYDELLYTQIENKVISFFANNNFGSRNNKGFGSFSVIEISSKIDPINWKDEYIIGKGISYMEFEVLGKFNMRNKERNIISDNCVEYYEQLFNVIDYYWKRLKSGINYTTWYEGQYPNKTKKTDPARYRKSYLFLYLKNKGLYTWEKRFVKEKFYGLNPQKEPMPFFYRGIMGLPDKFTYTKPSFLDTKDSEYPKYQRNANFDEISIKQDEKNKDIERIASPIYFKPIIEGNIVKVFVLIKDTHVCAINKEKLNKEFIFKMTKPDKPYEYKLLLPNIIDYPELIEMYNAELINENSSKNYFVPKDYNWNNILDKVEIKKI